MTLIINSKSVEMIRTLLINYFVLFTKFNEITTQKLVAIFVDWAFKVIMAQLVSSAIHTTSFVFKRDDARINKFF